MVGHMVRQILEQRDWVLDQTDVKVQSVPFSKAARYRRPDWFTFHAFRNSRIRATSLSPIAGKTDAAERRALDLLRYLRQPAKSGGGVRRQRHQAASSAGPFARLPPCSHRADAAPGMRRADDD
jgi:hypothetical protein